MDEFREEEDNKSNAAPLTLNIGVYGWRKRCLYFSLLLLLVIIAVNLALTIWILIVLDFNSEGIDKLEITDDGVRLEGVAEFREAVHARDISAIEGSNLTMASSQQVQMIAGGSRVTLRNDGIVIESNDFQVRSPEHDSPLLRLTNGEIVIEADILEAMGTRGVSLEGPIETNTLRAHNKQQLNIESASGSMNILGSQGVTVESTSGTINVQSFNELLFHSAGGPVVMDASNIQLQIPDISHTDNTQPVPMIYEVCICQNSGRIFLAAATDTDPQSLSNCATQQSMCV